MTHYDKERLDEIEERQDKIKRRLYLEEQLKGKSKINRKGEAIFIIALIFIVMSLIILFGTGT